MVGRRTLLVTLGTLALGGCMDRGDMETGDRPSLDSPAFEPGAEIPVRHTCDGADVSPPLEVVNVPSGAESLALVADDPDAPTEEPFVHWLLWNLPPETTEIPENVPPDGTVQSLDGARQGTNDFDDFGYGGPCPPEGDGPHTYRFVLSVLDQELDVEPGAGRTTLEDAMDGAVVVQAMIEAEYEREEGSRVRRR